MQDINEIRKKIDEVDSKLIDCYLKRMELTEEVAKLKMNTGKKIFDKKREEEKIENVMSYGRTQFEQEALKEMFEQIMSISRKRQYQYLSKCSDSVMGDFEAIDSLDVKDKIVVFQGTDGAYSQMALKAFFKDECKSYHVDRWRDAMDDLKNDKADYAVIPIENTVAGSVTENYDLLSEYGHCIVAELVIEIKHALLAKKGAKLSDIKRICSHPQALRQCSNFLNSHKDISQMTTKNTAMAAQMVSEGDDYSLAAIANPINADLYNLDILSDNIINVDTNATRFIIVSKKKVFVSDSDKLSVSFELMHKTGTLYYMLSHFIYNGLNLTKIESRPIEGSSFEYRFYCDIEGNLLDEAVKNALTGINSEAKNVQIIGCYRAANN